MSQKIKLQLKIVAIIVVVLAIGMQLQFVIIPTISAYTFWFPIGGFILLLIASQ